MQFLAASDIKIRMRKAQAHTQVGALLAGESNDKRKRTEIKRADLQRRSADAAVVRAHRSASLSMSNAEVARRRAHAQVHSQAAAALAFGGPDGHLRYGHLQCATGAQPWHRPTCRRVSCDGACAGCRATA